MTDSNTTNIKTHIELGHDLKLFFFDQVSPGSCFFLPHGFKVHSKLIKRMQAYYKKVGYQEVITPVMFEKKLWITSGHWEKYQDNMFLIRKEKPSKEQAASTSTDPLEDVPEYSLKAMNCPAHCVMFHKMNVSYKQLPLRLAEFGILHRNEASGALRGLTRVRKFQQDDSHIFCTLDQVEGEIRSLLLFIDKMYKELGFTYKIEVSTRPATYIGELDSWNKAEEILKSVVLSASGNPPVINEGDGAFYGPKIDISLCDSLNRWNQCATIQLDFNLPERFNLTYSDSDQSHKRPIMIHRAILGSLERFMAIVLEHTQGNLPFWMSPRQIMILPLKDSHLSYARSVASQFSDFDVDVNDSRDDLRQKIKEAEIMKYNYVVVIGDKELASQTLSVRSGGSNKVLSVPEFLGICKELVNF